METALILQSILATYALPPRGTHGVTYWARVLENELCIAEATGVNIQVVTLFALFHDSRQQNEHTDHGHGLRGAEFAHGLRGSLIHLSDTEFDLLYEACRLHTSGLTEGDATLQACWDADRLDLLRVGIRPAPHKLCTNAARKLLPWANKRANEHDEPELVAGVWQV